jgi:exosortase
MMSQDKLRLSLLNPMVGPIVLLVLLWADFIWIVHREWVYNDQYSYGWLTLFLLFYLIYVRISNRPEGTPGGFKVTALVWLGIVVMTVNRIVLESNPEWRVVLWLHALTIFAITLVLLWRMGGWRWLRHFAPVFALMLFAVPWPTFLENSVTGGLMQVVAAIVVESMNFCGIYAEQSGNLIRLRNGWVGIEAACSGVRNFQSTLMSAWFVGELFRFTFVGRGLLLLLSGIASLVLNVGRTWILTWSTHRSGSSLTETIHDPVGHIVSLIAFAFLIIVAFVLRKFFAREAVAPRATEAAGGQIRSQHRVLLSRPACFSAVALLIGGYGLTELWYYRAERSLPSPRAVEVDWQSLPFKVEFVDIAPAIRGLLKYSDGVQAEWVDAAMGSEWKVFSFAWTKGTVSPFVGVHSPETCMPASGFRKGGDHPPLVIGMGDHRIEFEVATFYFMERPYQVYYANWNDYWGAAVPLVKTADDRLQLAWSGRRVTNRRSLQIVIEGVADESVARQNVVGFLARTLRWKDPEAIEAPSSGKSS